MAGVLPIQRDALERVANANTEVVEIATKLVSLASHTSDPDLARDLYEQIEKLLGSSQEISNAMQQAVTSATKK